MKTKTAVLNGKPDAGNPHVRFDEGEVASAKPRRGSLLYNTWRKVGCCLVAAVAAFGSMSVSAKGIEEIFQKAESSGDYSSCPARNAFLTSYWLCDQAFSPDIDFFIQANLTEAYRPTSYTIDQTAGETGRRPATFQLLGWDAQNEQWILLDYQVGVVWDKAGSPQTFPVFAPKAVTKLRLRLLQPSGTSNRAYCINKLKFDDEPVAAQSYDLVRTARLNGTLSADATATLTGTAGNLIDEQLAADLVREAEDNGRWQATLAQGSATATVKFSADAFAGGVGLLTGYGFRMCIGSDSALAATTKNRLPSAWRVSVSAVESPTEDDWEVVDERTNVGLAEWSTFSITNVPTVRLDLSLRSVSIRQVRCVRFDFFSSVGDADCVQLGEIALRGYVSAAETDSKAYDVIGLEVVGGRAGATDFQAVVLPCGAVAAGYDLAVELVHGDRSELRTLVDGGDGVGGFSFEVPQLRCATDYDVRLRLVDADGRETASEWTHFVSEADEIPAVILPEGFIKLEYVQSTEGGRQGVILGSQSAGYGLEVDCIAYNALDKTGSWNGTTNGCGTLYSGSFSVSTSTGASGDYLTGLRRDTNPRQARLLIGSRILISHRGQSYEVYSEGERVPPLVNSSGSGYAYTGRDNSTATDHIYLFGNYDTAKKTMVEYSVMRLYSAKIYNGDTVTHFYQPAQASDGTNGLLDLLDENPETAWYPCIGETNLVAGAILPAGSCSAAVDSFTGTRLKATLTRGNAVKEDAIFAVWGPDYGGLDTSAWAHQQALGKSFKAGEQTAAVTLKGLADSDVYVRFYTANGRWSQTVYLPDLERQRRGTVLILK